MMLSCRLFTENQFPAPHPLSITHRLAFVPHPLIGYSYGNIRVATDGVGLFWWGGFHASFQRSATLSNLRDDIDL